MRPPSSELNKKVWYRLLKIITITVVVAAFVVPWLIQKPSPWILIDGLINAVAWLVVAIILRTVILYIVYGRQERTSEEKKRILLLYNF